jgi:hypothetical protein
LHAEQFADELANVKDFIVQVVRNHFGEVDQETVEKLEESYLAALVSLRKHHRLDVGEHDLKELKHFHTRTASMAESLNALQHRHDDSDAVVLDLVCWQLVEQACHDAPYYLELGKTVFVFDRVVEPENHHVDE